MSKFFLIVLFVATLPVYAQHVIHTERPGDVQSLKTAGKHVFQFETGYLREEHHEGYSRRRPEMLFRYGVNDWLEFRLTATVERVVLVSERISRDGFRPIEPGLQMAFVKNPKKFQAALQAHVGLPFLSSESHDPGKAYHRIRLLADHKVSEHFSISANAGSDWDHKKHHQNWMYGFSPELEITERFKVITEVFGFVKEGHHPENMLAAGISYAFHNNISADFSYGVGLNEASPKYFYGIGIAFRVH